MGKTCAVVDCGKTTKAKVSIFKCPNDKKAIGRWRQFLEIANMQYKGFWKQTKDIFICSDHFESAFTDVLPSNRIQLRRNAFPRLMAGESIYNEDEHGIYEVESITISMDQDSSDAGFLKAETTELQLKVENLQQEVKSLQARIADNEVTIQRLVKRQDENETLIQSLNNKLEQKKNLLTKYQKINEVSRRKSSRKIISAQRKAWKRKAEEEGSVTVKRKKQVVEQRLDSQALSILNELIERGNKPANASFSDLLKEFAYEINYYSHRAYEKLREKISTLPFVSSFRRWTSHIKTSPGFIPASLDFIRKRVAESPFKIHYALMVDEVHIRRQIIPHKGGFIGYVDYGDMASPTFSQKEASAALFVMANEVNGYNKIPLGYILTNGLPQNVLADVIINSVNKMKELNANVISLTFDGLASNSKAVESLGAHMDVRTPEFKPSFPGFGKNEIHVILDASHMIKLMRNLFKQYGILVNGNGEEIRWEFIDFLDQLQEAEGLRAANKISSRHVRFENQKMRTKLAAQTLSGSAAISLRFCRELGINGFENTTATEEFLNILNKLFDYLNSVRHGKGYRAPITWGRYQEVKDFFAMCKKYLLQLKWRHSVKGKVVDTPIVDSPKKTAIHGLIITMTSIENLMVELLADSSSDLKYLPTFKVSQDPLENFFGSLRSRYGFNNNPNVLQLEQGVKGMICMKTKAIKSGNCEEQEDLSTKVSALGNFRVLVDDNAILEEQDEEPTDLELGDLSPFISNIVMYISGYVATKLIKRIQCQSCILKLYATESDIPLINSDSSLTMYRDKGGLFLSSYAMLSVCKITEQVIRAKEIQGIKLMKKEELLNNVVHECMERGFVRLIDCGHCSRNFLDSSHAISLIKRIATFYCGTRFKHLANRATLRLKPTTNRNILTRSVIFSGN